MSHRDSVIKKNKELKKPMDLMNVGFVGAAAKVVDPSIILDDGFSSSSGWTHIGGQSQTSITGGELVVNNSQGHVLDQMTKSLGQTLDNTWLAQIDWKRTAYSGSGGGEAVPLAVLSGNGGLWDWYGGTNGSTDDAIAITHWSTAYGMAVRTGNGNNYSISTSISLPSSGTWHYLTLERIDQDTVKLSVFTDSARTTHASNSPHTWDISSYGSAITGLSYVSTGNYLANGSTHYRYVTAYGDNILVRDT